MKIAVFHNLPSGGAKRALFSLVHYLTRNGHEIDAYVPETADESFLPLTSADANLNVVPLKHTLKGSIFHRFYYPLSSNEVNLRDLENTEKEIAEAINSREYDVVFSEQDQFTMAPFFLKYIKKPTVYYCPQPRRNDVILTKLDEYVEPKHSPFKRIIFKVINERSSKKDFKIDKDNSSFAKYILANSYFTHESILRAYGLNSFVSYLGIDTNIFKPLETPKEDFILSVGTITPSKGYDFIIRSLSMIEPKIRPKFVIVSNAGDKLWENYLKELCNQLNVDIEILRLITDKELVELYNKAKLVVFAPYLEPFGLVPLESMACGTPVVAVKEGGMRETVVHNETGILIERNESLFAKHIINLLSDNKKTDEMSRKSVETINGFWTLEHAGKRLEEHLKNAIYKKIY